MGRSLMLLVLALVLSPLTALAQTPLSERSVSDLLDGLENPNPAVRIDLIGELARRRTPRALVPLIGRLKDDVPSVRAYAAEALRVLGDERAVPFLSRSLEDRDPTVRCRAVLALGDLGGKYLLPTIVRLLSDPSVVVRAASIRAIGEIGDRLSRRAVLKAQEAEKVDKDSAVSAAASIAGAKLGGKEGFAASLALAKPKLTEYWFLRASAAHAAGLAGALESAPMLVRYLRTDPDLRVCQAAAGSLAALGLREHLTASLSDETAFRRKAALAALATLEGQDVMLALVEATRDSDPAVALEAGSALLGRGEREAFPVLIGLLEDASPVWLGALDVLLLRTGLDFGRNPPRWKTWFEERGEKLEFDPETGVYRGAK